MPRDANQRRLFGGWFLEAGEGVLQRLHFREREQEMRTLIPHRGFILSLTMLGANRVCAPLGFPWLADRREP